RIIRELGRGGMGVVYEAEDQTLKRRVALKVLGANVAGSPVQLARFRHEAESAAGLHHPRIVPVFGSGEAHGAVFYVVQYVDGLPLSEVIERLGSDFQLSSGEAAESPPAPGGGKWRDHRTVARVFVDLADALAYAHGQGVLHRDIKPANILVDREGEVWI